MGIQRQEELTDRGQSMFASTLATAGNFLNVHVYKYTSPNKKDSTDQVIGIVNALLGGIYAGFFFFIFYSVLAYS